MGVKSAISVATLVGELGRVEGRKRLQKIVHLLGVSGAREFRHRFILHYYGPFSRELAADLDFLQAAKLLEETPPERPNEPYVYTLSTSEDVQERLHTLGPEEGDMKTAWVDLAKKLKREEAGRLEALSTVVFLENLGHAGATLKDEFARIKPNLKDEFEAAIELGRKLKLLPRPASA